MPSVVKSFKEKIISFPHKLFLKSEKKEIIPDSFYESILP